MHRYPLDAVGVRLDTDDAVAIHCVELEVGGKRRASDEPACRIEHHRAMRGGLHLEKHSTHISLSSPPVDRATTALASISPAKVHGVTRSSIPT